MVLSGVGATLREERMRRKVSLEHVSKVTRIAARYLDAIENNRPSDLPGIVFTRGFVQQYARFLNLPDEALLAQLPRVDVENAALPTPPSRERKPFWTPRVTSAMLRSGGFVLSAGLVGAAWVQFDIAPVLNKVAHSAYEGTLVKVGRVKSQLSSGPATPSPTQVAVAQVVPKPTPRETTAAPELPAEQTAAAVLPASSAIQVLLTARANAWVQVTADGKAAFTGLLHTNDSREISGNQLVKVMTGNAGGLEISLNGKTLDSIGPEGQVRTVRLTAEGLLPDRRIPVPGPDPL